MTGSRVILPSPHPGQREVLSNPARFKWLACGMRSRKTTLALHPAVLSAINGATILWGAPTADQTGVGWEECKIQLVRSRKFANRFRIMPNFHQAAELFLKLWMIRTMGAALPGMEWFSMKWRS